MRDIIKKPALARRFSLAAVIPYTGIIVVFLFFLIWSKGAILTKTNIQAILNQAYSIMLISAGAIFIYAYGGMDFSLGALLGACSLIMTLVIRAGEPVWLGIVLVIAFGLLSGFLCGWLSRVLNLLVFIVTLSFSYIWSGLVEYGCVGGLMYLPSEFCVRYSLWSIKIAVLVLVLLISYFFFRFNRFGKYVKAIGGNQVVAALNGINVTKYIVLAHMAAGLCVAIATIFSLARAGSCNAHAGARLQLDVMISLVLGGVPLSGGVRSRFSAVVVGAMIMALLANGLVLCGASQYLVEGTTGLIFIIVVAVSFRHSKNQIIS